MTPRLLWNRWRYAVDILLTLLRHRSHAAATERTAASAFEQFNDLTKSYAVRTPAGCNAG